MHFKDKVFVFIKTLTPKWVQEENCVLVQVLNPLFISRRWMKEQHLIMYVILWAFFSSGCKAVEFLPHLSKLLYQLAQSVLLTDGKYLQVIISLSTLSQEDL